MLPAILFLTILPAGGESVKFWNDSGQLLLLGIERLAREDFREAVPLIESSLRLDSDSALARAWLAHAYHLQRRLDEAGTHYRELLKKEPAREADATRRAAILRFAPRVFQVSSDPFGLLDAIAIHHPDEPLIAYHFFWEDDIDFPADNDPCDHELVWVRYDPADNKLVGLQTYFHGRILSSPSVLREATDHSGRPLVNVQWGKHGSLPHGWEDLRIQAMVRDIERDYLDMGKPQTLREYNLATYQNLRKEGRQFSDHARTSAWPVRFQGSWDDFIRFEKEVDLLSHLSRTGRQAISRWNNAALQQNFLAYNFRPKTEWPDDPYRESAIQAQSDRRVGAASDALLTPSEGLALRKAASASGVFLRAISNSARGGQPELPPMKVFHPETPRYPNIWVYAPVERFPAYRDLIGFLDDRLRNAGYHSEEVSLNEGADLALSVEHLQPWDGVLGLRHAHDLHLRLFWKRLEKHALHRVELKSGGRSSAYWLVAGSVHYEVEHAHPLHADVEVCPFCGRTGEYAETTGNLVEVAHDPLGVELLLRGTIRSERVRTTASGEFPSLVRIFQLSDENVFVTRPSRKDMNTAVLLTFQLSRRE